MKREKKKKAGFQLAKISRGTSQKKGTKFTKVTYSKVTLCSGNCEKLGLPKEWVLYRRYEE